MRVVVALGGNALLKRGEPMTAENQRRNIQIAAKSLAPIAEKHQLVISHGNGPQVGLLALQAAAYREVAPYPLDILGAQTEGMIGYMIENELGNLLPMDRPFATMLTMIEVRKDDPAFEDPTKFIGPIYDEITAKQLAEEKGWAVKPDGNYWRRVVPSPRPVHIFQLRPIKWLLEKNTIVICGGGGGIPTMFDENRQLRGVEAVIDKDLATGLLAREIEADMFIMATDVDGVYENFGTPEQRRLERINPRDIKGDDYAKGSMGPKVSGAIEFALMTNKPAAIGSLEDLEAIVEGKAGTIFDPTL